MSEGEERTTKSRKRSKKIFLLNILKRSANRLKLFKKGRDHMIMAILIILTLDLQINIKNLKNRIFFIDMFFYYRLMVIQISRNFITV
jgi:hypothetical protein